jgi:hypothetical protein
MDPLSNLSLVTDLWQTYLSESQFTFLKVMKNTMTITVKRIKQVYIAKG